MIKRDKGRLGMSTRKFKFRKLLILVTVLLISYTSWRWHKMNYEMAVIEHITDWNEAEFPSKKYFLMHQNG